MKKSIQYLFTVVIMVIGICLTACLCAGAIRTQKKASLLNQAVLCAQNASEIFYACSSREEMTSLLGGELEGNTIRCAPKDGLSLRLLLEKAGENELRAEIALYSDEGEVVYTLSCIRYVEGGSL